MSLLPGNLEDEDMTNVVNGTQPQDKAGQPEPFLSYTRMFMPTGPDGKAQPLALDKRTQQQLHGDQTNGLEYEYSEDVILAVNIAIATNRPLLVSGSPGTGKSSLARSVARWQGWPFYEYVITSRTQARDILWRFDSLRRLGDAQVATDAEARQRLNDRFVYIEPGVLWWAFDPSNAQRRGAPQAHPCARPATDPAITLGPRPRCDWIPEHESIAQPKRAVVLLDEIDKADPDVPNDLLVPLGGLRFEVAETETKVMLAHDLAPPLIIITNNRERDLPPAFLRRCITLTLPDPDVPWLVKIAMRRFGVKDQELYTAVAQQMLQDRQSDSRIMPGTAEFLDAVRTCQELNVKADGANIWERVRRATLLKGRVSEEQV